MLVKYVFLIISFLFAIANIYILTEDSDESKLQKLAVSLSLSCLSFDFLGTSFDESSDEIGTVQV